MKSVVAVVSLLLMLAAGCSNEYRAEKLYWRTMSRHGATMNNPRSATEKEFAAAVGALRTMVRRYPAWNNSALLQLVIGQMYAERTDLRQAREELMKVVMNYPGNAEVCAHALFLIATLHEKEGDWKNALKAFRDLSERYPATMAGLQAPLHIVEHYRRNKLEEEGAIAAERALRGYLDFIEINPYAERVTFAQTLIVNLLSGQGRWNDAVHAMLTIARKYPDSDAAPHAVYRAALIYRDTLRQPDESLAVMRQLIVRYPGSPVTKEVRFSVGNLLAGQGDYAAARREFGAIIEHYRGETSLCAAARLAIAGSYEEEGKLEEALREYRHLRASYPGTAEAMRVPLLLAHLQHQTGRNAEAERTLNEAIDDYTAMIRNDTGGERTGAAYEFVAIAYSMQNRWAKALETLKEFREKYPRSQETGAAMFRMALIYRNVFHDDGKTKYLLEQLVSGYPAHPFAAAARRMLEEITADGGKSGGDVRNVQREGE